MKKTTWERITEILFDHLGSDPVKIKLTDRLVEDLGADSLDMVEIVMSLEHEFAINIPDETADKLITVQDIVDLLKPHT